jgi:hypothetical protein
MMMMSPRKIADFCAWGVIVGILRLPSGRDDVYTLDTTHLNTALLEYTTFDTKFNDRK